MMNNWNTYFYIPSNAKKKEVETSVFSSFQDICILLDSSQTHKQETNIINLKRAFLIKRSLGTLSRLAPTVTLNQDTVSQSQTTIFKVFVQDTGMDIPLQSKSSISALQSAFSGCPHPLFIVCGYWKLCEQSCASHFDAETKLSI